MTWHLFFGMLLTAIVYAGSFLAIIAIFWLLKEFLIKVWPDHLEDEEIIFHEDGWDGVKNSNKNS